MIIRPKESKFQDDYKCTVSIHIHILFSHPKPDDKHIHRNSDKKNAELSTTIPLKEWESRIKDQCTSLANSGGHKNDI
jgi:hypothetical protein